MQTSQTGGQLYSDTFPFSIPWFMLDLYKEFIKLVLRFAY